MKYRVACATCGKKASSSAFRCSRCNSVLEIRYDYSTLKLAKGFRRQRISSSKYIDFFPVDKLKISAGEGSTPLLSKKFQDQQIFIKLETKNPTHSFKDRGSVVEINKLTELGFRSSCCASTGNMGISVARYSKLAGVKATIFISKDADRRKIAIIKRNGARIVKVTGDFNRAMDLAEKFAKKTGAFVCGDYHYRKEGQKSVIFEIIDQLGYSVPDFVFVPVGNATLLAAVYKGLKEFKKVGLIRKFPKIVAVQSEKCDPLVRAYDSQKRIKHMVPRTIADAIAVGYPTFGFEGLRGLREYKGLAVSVSEDEIKGAVKKLKGLGIRSETGGAAGFGGFVKLYNSDRKKFKGKKIVVVVTGNN